MLFTSERPQTRVKQMASRLATTNEEISNKRRICSRQHEEGDEIGFGSFSLQVKLCLFNQNWAINPHPPPPDPPTLISVVTVPSVFVTVTSVETLSGCYSNKWCDCDAVLCRERVFRLQMQINSINKLKTWLNVLFYRMISIIVRIRKSFLRNFFVSA